MEAASIAEERAHAHSRSRCWHYVKEALLASGVIETRPKTELTDRDYCDFYQHIAGEFADPLAWVHARIEGTYEYFSSQQASSGGFARRTTGISLHFVR